jgi:hypothetical protein
MTEEPGAEELSDKVHSSLRQFGGYGEQRPQDPPILDSETLGHLAGRYLPRLSESGFEVRITPRPVQRVLESLYALRADTERQESPMPIPKNLPDPDPRFVQVFDFGHRLLRWLQPIHEEFAGIPLVASAVYGMRVYCGGGTLRMHYDRIETHVVSSVLQVAQDVDEGWPLVLEHQGSLHEVLLEPGQMVLYEGAACEHGRPRPLRGRSFVNLFAHYRPLEWPWSNEEITRRALLDGVIDADGHLTDERAG